MPIDPLAALRPLHDPAAISWWPPAPGWWGLFFISLVLVWLFFRSRKRRRLQQAALTELKLLTAKDKTPLPQPAMINQLLKRYALVCWPTTKVAALTGESWLAFLDEHGGNGAFSKGPGRILLTSPYAREMQHNQALVDLARQWIKINVPHHY